MIYDPRRCALSLIALAFLFGCSDNGFEQVAYFKNSWGDRIFVYTYAAAAPTDSVNAFAAQLANTPRQMTAAYFFPAGTSMIPRDGVTLAGSIERANTVLYETPGLARWRHAYMRGFNGAELFADCVATPKHDLCRQTD